MDLNTALLSVHQISRMGNLRSKGFADTLVSETHAENRYPAIRLFDEFLTDSRILWVSRPRR